MIYAEHGDNFYDAAGAQQQQKQQWVDDYQEPRWWHSIDPHLNNPCTHVGLDNYLLIVFANLEVVVILELCFLDGYILYHPFDGKVMAISFGCSPMNAGFVVVNDSSFVADVDDHKPCF